VPYFIAGHPGSDVSAMIDLALYLKRHDLKSREGARFHPRPVGYCHLHGITPASTR